MKHATMYRYFRPGRFHCEWDPELNRPARTRDDFHAFAEVHIPHRRLQVCGECASRRRFARLLQEPLEGAR